MPHVTIEYSANVADHHDVQALVDAVHDAALDHGLAGPTALRTRAAERAHYRVTDGSPDYAFVAIVARVGPGRDEEVRQAFLAAMLDAAEAHCRSESEALTIAWSAEVQEIDSDFRINRNHVRTAMDTRESG